MRAPSPQNDPSAAPKGPASTATFHARVASVGLITTVVVLLAACLTFTFQQWAVAGAEYHRIHENLATVTARAAGPVMAVADPERLSGALATVQVSEDVIEARLTDLEGRELTRFHRPTPSEAPTETFTRPVLREGEAVGQLSMTVLQPQLGPKLPQFIALTFVLLFGGVGVALFLARGLAANVIRPVLSLSAAMREVAGGGSFTPVEIKKGADELFQSLTSSFNHLLAKLGEREADLKRTMRELETARDEANAANTLKTQFLANMSHEIRTPLNGVLAMAEVMELSDLEPVQRDRLDVIRSSGDLLLAVLNDVLDLSKIEAGKLTLLEYDFELGPAVAQVRENFAVMAEGKGLEFSVEVTDEAKGWWRGDADRLRQIIGNLLSNAVKFTTEGAITALVEVGAAGELRLIVNDTGVGISLEKLPALFEKFTQADNSATRRFGGTGLGLAICRELTQMMGGSIVVSSREGIGSTFTVDLPLERGAPAGVSVEESGCPAEEGDFDCWPLKITQQTSRCWPRFSARSALRWTLFPTVRRPWTPGAPAPTT